MCSGLPALVTSRPSTCMHVFSKLFKKHAFELLYIFLLHFVLIAVHVELLIDQLLLTSHVLIH